MGQLGWYALGVFITSLILQFVVIRFSHKRNLFIDSHTEEKPQNFHDFSTPRAGGIGIIAGMIFLLFTPLGWKLLFSILLAFLSGIFEDFHRSLSPRTRLFLQLIAASSAVTLSNSFITYLGFSIFLPSWVGILFSIFAIVGMMNAVNIIDGFNGLASSITLLILLSFGLISFHVEDNQILTMIVITAASVFGFFLLNFPKGKIFLGDGGAYLLGFMIALIGIFLASNYDTISPWFILSVLIYPTWEVLFSIFRKLRAGHSPMEPDSYHIHMLIYRNVTKNNPLTTAVILITVGPFILIPTFYPANSIANFATALLFVLCYSLFYRYLTNKENSN